ncbi:MAG: hypothetical protein LBE35_00305 [Clostridiales bacterium]|jgi:hypothetical protein|nr:hypothetical protein [Clostridiales bacterium]
MTTTKSMPGLKNRDYAALSVGEHDRERAIAWLMAELEKGRKSGEEHGWFTADEVKKSLGLSP